MNITPKFNFVEGSFDTKEVKMLCIASDNSRRMTFEVLGIATVNGYEDGVFYDNNKNNQKEGNE